jgi:hypothetical protein
LLGAAVVMTLAIVKLAHVDAVATRERFNAQSDHLVRQPA